MAKPKKMSSVPMVQLPKGSRSKGPKARAAVIAEWNRRSLNPAHGQPNEPVNPFAGGIFGDFFNPLKKNKP